MKIKDVSKKEIVEVYQKQVKEAIDRLIALEIKPSPQRKMYIKGLEDNIKRAPYFLGYLEYPQKKN